jgi:hypothetical protein
MSNTSHTGAVLTGDWRKLNYFLKSSGTLAEEVNQGIREKAEELRDAVVENIPLYQTVSNAEKTIKHKGFDAPLFEQGNLKKNIDVFDYKDASGSSGNKVYYIVKGNPDVQVEHDRGKETEADKTYEGLLEILENGTDKIPARPILTIVWNRYGGRITNEIIKTTEDAIKRRLRAI